MSHHYLPVNIYGFVSISISYSSRCLTTETEKYRWKQMYF